MMLQDCSRQLFRGAATPRQMLLAARYMLSLELFLGFLW